MVSVRPGARHRESLRSAVVTPNWVMQYAACRVSRGRQRSHSRGVQRKHHQRVVRPRPWPAGPWLGTRVHGQGRGRATRLVNAMVARLVLHVGTATGAPVGGRLGRRQVDHFDLVKKRSTNGRGFHTTMPWYPDAFTRCLSPLTIVLHRPAIAQARNLSSSGSVQICTGSGLGWHICPVVRERGSESNKWIELTDLACHGPCKAGSAPGQPAAHSVVSMAVRKVHDRTDGQ